MMSTLFSMDEIPFDVLERFGLTEDMIEDLPESVLEDINNGRRSPVLPVQFSGEDGKVLSSFRARFALVRMDDDKVDVLFYPCKETCDIERYDDFQQDKLLQGKSVIDDVVTKDGRTLRAFIQVDKETNHVLYVPTPVIGKNIQILADDFGLSTAELQSLHNGEPFTFVTEGEPMTVGIDLQSKTGIRFCSGDIQRWIEQGKEKYGQYNFGINGCWVKDADGGLDYVREDDYTDDIMQEFQKVVSQSRTSSRRI